MFWPMGPADEYGQPHFQEEPRIEQRRPRVVRTRPKLPDAPKDTAKPRGPIVIAISIEKQQLKLYDQNGLFAESPVSTGMRGHSTPMGVFSVIQKNKYHRSNIYSGAPMPYMQRVTWSGIAMHAGALPGYPASHGCIRMPMNFAMRMWGWTRMGARVIVTPGEVSPADFSHPLLMTRKPESKPVAAVPVPQDHSSAASKPDGSSIAEAAFEKAELRLTPITDRSAPIRTADARSAMPQQNDASGEASATNVIAPKDDAESDITATTPTADEKSIPVRLPLEGSAEFIGPVKPRSGHLAAYVSRKDGKIYVRQNFEPWFEAPVTIAASGRPLGTHVFTVRADKDEPDSLRWSVVSLPSPARTTHAHDDTPRRKRAAAVEPVTHVPSSTPTEALDRLTIPDDVMTRIASALAPGGSLVVSDQGLGDETGRGTDFIVPLR